ncbi:MAG: hypothetical protein WAW35_11980 [Sideroxyarcus sp.]
MAAWIVGEQLIMVDRAWHAGPTASARCISGKHEMNSGNATSCAGFFSPEFAALIKQAAICAESHLIAFAGVYRGNNKQSHSRRIGSLVQL